jgi:hypothetical protein
MKEYTKMIRGFINIVLGAVLLFSFSLLIMTILGILFGLLFGA